MLPLLPLGAAFSCDCRPWPLPELRCSCVMAMPAPGHVPHWLGLLTLTHRLTAQCTPGPLLSPWLHPVITGPQLSLVLSPSPAPLSLLGHGGTAPSQGWHSPASLGAPTPPGCSRAPTMPYPYPTGHAVARHRAAVQNFDQYLLLISTLRRKNTSIKHEESEQPGCLRQHLLSLKDRVSPSTLS